MTQNFKDAIRDEASLRAALAEADISPSLMVLTQLSGDFSLLNEAAPFIEGAWDYQQTVPEELRQKICDRLVDVLKEYAGSGRKPPTNLNAETFQKIMSGGVGSNVPDEYMPLVMEEMGFGLNDTRQVNWRSDPQTLPLTDFKVIIVGAGLSGICAGIHLKKAGIPFTILEKNEKPGGTWFENHYPGCGVDIPSHFYSYSFFTDFPWSRHFSLRDELLQYLLTAIDRFDIGDSIQYNKEVISADWDENAQKWTVLFKDACGKEQSAAGNALLCAVGQLNKPALPNIEGLQQFEGPCFHTARWPEDIDLKGKKVAMIGTGASGMQVAPTIASEVGQLSIFQRTPHWAFHHPNYHREISLGLKWAIQHIPFYSKWYRFTLFWATSDGLYPSLLVDPTWKETGSISAQNKKLRETIEAHIRKELDNDENLLKKCLPDYPPYSKRMLRDNYWYRTLKRENVELITGKISGITTTGIAMEDGRNLPADVLILATGFNAQKMLAPLEIRGRHGVSIRDVWGDDNPRAYLGVMSPGFPNLFFAYGPNTNLVHGGSIFFQAECQVHYMMEALREMIEHGYSTIDVKTDVHDEYNERVDEACQKLAWGQTTVKNWYQNKNRRVFANSPWKLIEYWRMTQSFNPSDHLIRKTTSASTTATT